MSSTLSPPRRTSIISSVRDEVWAVQCLSVVVVGASGDLAKKKTYPSLLSLYAGGLLPPSLVVYGYARSSMTDADLRERIRPHLEGKADDIVIDSFLDRCHYQSGAGYGDHAGWGELNAKLDGFEASAEEEVGNRLFYFAVPPNVFAETGGEIGRSRRTGIRALSRRNATSDLFLMTRLSDSKRRSVPPPCPKRVSPA